jgi:hypothetical protein
MINALSSGPGIWVFFADAVHAATITVTSIGDAVAVNGNVRLREAINSINAVRTPVTSLHQASMAAATPSTSASLAAAVSLLATMKSPASNERHYSYSWTAISPDGALRMNIA